MNLHEGLIRRLVLEAGVIAIAIVIASGFARAQVAPPSGLAVSPDGRAYIVNKDVQGKRWTVVANVAPGGEIVNIAGVIRNASGDVDRFVNCAVRPDSPCNNLGPQVNPSCILRLQCDQAAPCDDFALSCGKTPPWSPAVDDLPLATGFFVRGTAAASGVKHGIEGTAHDSSAARAAATPTGKASTLTPRLESFLTSRPVGAAERWTVALQVDHNTNKGVATGNIFRTDGQPPQFVYCTSKEGESVPLFLAFGSMLDFDCVGTGACTGDTATCEGNWTALASPAVPASFFLPPGGLEPATTIDLTSCFFVPPPCTQAPVDESNGSASRASAGPACAIGAGCSVATDTCGTLNGQLVQKMDGNCACEVSVADPACRPCVGAGESCSIGVQTTAGCSGSSCPRVAAFGICQVVSSSGDTVCTDLANVTQPTCAGIGSTSCSGDTCCVDDARDGCDPNHGDVNCPGLCVPGSTGPACLPPGPQKCPNSRIDPGEQCDTDNLNGASCESLELGSGTLGCSRSCQFDTSGCGGEGCGDGQITPPEICDPPGAEVPPSNGDFPGSTRAQCGGSCESLECQSGSKLCNDYCIPNEADCCSDAFSFCGPGSVCAAQESGGFSCCPTGFPFICDGGCSTSSCG